MEVNSKPHSIHDIHVPRDVLPAKLNHETSPRAQKRIKYLERLQNVFLFFNLPGLFYRRVRVDMIHVSEYLHGIYGVQLNLLTKDIRQVTRSHALKVAKKHNMMVLTGHTFCLWVVILWNNLLKTMLSQTPQTHWTHLKLILTSTGRQPVFMQPTNEKICWRLRLKVFHTRKQLTSKVGIEWSIDFYIVHTPKSSY